MILFCGIPSEPPLALAIDAAAELGLDHVVVNQRNLRYHDMHLSIEDGRITGELWASERRWPLDGFTGVYVRLMDVHDLPEHRIGRRGPASGDARGKAEFLDATLQAWLEIADCRVVNRQRPSTSNVSKPYQQQAIHRCGLRTPATLVTKDPAEAQAFARRHGRVIYKSISSVRSIVHELTADRTDDLDRLRDLPTQFQALVEGDDVRVHVIGDQLFATRIQTGAIDYRYAQRDGHDVGMEPFTLPPAIAARCHELSRTLELPFCGIDFKLTADGDYVCFEVNPSPAYSYYQETAGQPIARALVEYLSGRDAPPPGSPHGRTAAAGPGR